MMTEDQDKKWIAQLVAECVAMGVLAKKAGCVEKGSIREEALAKLEKRYSELCPLPEVFHKLR